MAKVNLIAPWNEYYEELVAFFAEDREVTILYDEAAKNIKVLVQDPLKAEALTGLLAGEKEFGSTKLVITVVPANEPDTRVKSTLASLRDNEGFAAEYRVALHNNGLFSYVHEIENVMGFNAIFVVFKTKVVQYYNDNLGDLNGMKSTLAENIARDIFVPHNGVFFCTNINNNRTVNQCRDTSISSYDDQYC